MRDSVMWFLITSVVVSALFVVNVRHEHRIAYVAFQTEQARRDALDDEWGQLLVEESLWAFPHRIERDASRSLSMRAPNKDEIKFVGINARASEVQDGTR
ncbi:hypothetical protein GCM10008090_14320 [Arenicella chitinivorans]|uniref:Cell division protein FtsL n=1 Tax=Arenicella chitinivorans TaxID=1329800 RepID=A0A918VLJ0_9GAMM|nr:cell division protein FtsL [Arenicella chitinivorans]GHA05819.1 hypothetical protein GCM10008090_14320 [Arenicella chitinivorans]